MKPLPFPTGRRAIHGPDCPRRPLPQSDPDFAATILERLALLSDQIDEIADLVIQDATRRHKAADLTRD